jgi:hypothetical protein
VALAGLGRAVRRLLAALLVAEAAWWALAFVALVPALPGHDASVVLVIVARAAVVVVTGAAGGALWSGRPPAPPLATAAWSLSAALTVADVGLQLAPTPVYPWWRWHVVTAYLAFALVAVVAVRRIGAE